MHGVTETPPAAPAYCAVCGELLGDFAAAALRPRIVTVAEAGAVVRPATAAERERWTLVEFGGVTVAAVRVEAE